jgi:hypothetical protein
MVYTVYSKTWRISMIQKHIDPSIILEIISTLHNLRNLPIRICTTPKDEFVGTLQLYCRDLQIVRLSDMLHKFELVFRAPELLHTSNLSPFGKSDLFSIDLIQILGIFSTGSYSASCK